MTRALLEQALEALESLFSGQVDVARGARCADAIQAIRAHLANTQGKPIGKVLTRKVSYEYEGSEKQDTVGYWVHDYVWFKRPEVEGTTYLYTHPAHLAKPDTAPAWHDAPTVPGLWVWDRGPLKVQHLIDVGDLQDCLARQPTGLERWFGPIPEDKP